MGERQEPGPACAQCGYELTGLQRYGKCPECGSFYDMQVGTGLVSSKAERMQRTDRLLARIRTILLVLAAIAVMGCGGLATLVANNKSKPLAIAGVIAFLFLFAAVTSFVYEKQD